MGVLGRVPRSEVAWAGVSRGFLRTNLTINLTDGGGALTSGIREAKRLLGTPAVCISVNHTGAAQLWCILDEGVSRWQR